MQGVFESDDDIDEALEKLTDRALLSTQTSDDGSLSYKLHGLLAESLREQIDYSVENYPIYEKNTKISDIHRNDSIDEDICKYTSISLWGEKKQDQPEWQYLSVLAHRTLARLTTNIKSILLHLNKSIEIGSKLPTDNPEYQDICAETYLILGYFIQSYCEDYKLAQEYYDQRH